MVRPICRDVIFLAQKSSPATSVDLPVARDLADTLVANRERCVGMAANMIGVARRIIAFLDGGQITVMLNPEIVKCSGPFEAEEGCLSLTGARKTTRFQTLRVRYQDSNFHTYTKSYVGWTAQIIQHEIDHCNGILI